VVRAWSERRSRRRRVFAQDVNIYLFNYIFIIFYNEYRQIKKMTEIENFLRLIKGKWFNNGGKAPMLPQATVRLSLVVTSGDYA
jgi:hypothetical protein